MNRLILLGTSFVLFACQSPQAREQHRGVGLWREEGPNIEAITLRNPDGTMKRKEIRRFDYAKEPGNFFSAWVWVIKGNDYGISLSETSRETSRNFIGKTWDLKVLSLDENIFRYLSSDGALVEERRIGNASNAELDKAQLKGL